MLDNTVNLSDIPVANSGDLTSNDTVLGLVGNAAKRIKTADIKPDLSTIETDITNLQTSVTTIEGQMSGVSSVTTDVANLKTHTSSSNTNVSNANLSSLINSLANKEGYEIKTSPSSNPTIGRTLPAQGAIPNLYPAPTATGFIDELLLNVLGSTPTVAGSGDSAVYTHNYVPSTAMNSQYVLDLRSNLFDNNWVGGRQYYANTVVVYNNEIYKCVTPNNDSVFTPAKWIKVGSAQSGGGGLSGSNFELWKRLRGLVLEGISRELSPEYMWANPEETLTEFSSTSIADAKTYWENHYSTSLGYMPGGHGQNANNWFDNDYIFYINSYNTFFPSESLYRDNASKLKSNLLQLLSAAIDSYISFNDSARNNLKYSYSTGESYDNLPIGSLAGYSGYDNYVTTNTPTYTVDSTTGIPTVTGVPSYNDQSDLIKRIVSLCSPKRITGIFRAANWVTTETGGRINWCPLTDINNPEHAHILHSAIYSDSDPSGTPYEDCSASGFNYIFYDAIMDVYLPGIETGTENTNNNLRKQILEAYSLIQDTNISYQNTLLSSLEKSEQYSAAQDTQAKDILNEKNNWNIGGDCSAIRAYLDPEATPPTVDIPVQILIFPKAYDRNDYIQTQNNS